MTDKRRTHKPRRTAVSPHSGEGRELGLDDREIPGGLNHLANAESHVSKAHVPATEHIKAGEAHGVPPRDPDEPYASPRPGERVVTPKPAQLPREEDAVPVFIVEGPGRQRVRRDVAAEQITVPAAGSDPVRVCSVDSNRVQISLLNDDAANDNQFSESIGTVIEQRGAILPHGATSYRTLKTQGELWALSTAASAVKMSKIIETEINA